MSEISPIVGVLFDENNKLTKTGALIFMAIVVGVLCNSLRLLRGKRL